MLESRGTSEAFKVLNYYNTTITTLLFTTIKFVNLIFKLALQRGHKFLIKSIKETEESIELSSKGVNTLKNITDYTTTKRALKNCLLMFDFYYDLQNH